MLDIKKVFQKKYPGFYLQHPWLSRLFINITRRICKEKEFQQFTAAHCNSDGINLINDAFAYLNFSPIISNEHLTKIPMQGRVIIILNHATALDGIGLIKVLHAVRTDIKVVINELLLTTDVLKDLTISVSMTTKGISKTSFKSINSHLQQEGALIIFPSGKPSRIYHGKIQDDKWNSGFLKIALKNNCPILPVYVDGKYSNGFYIISKLLFNIATMLPIREVHKLRNKQETFYVGELLNVETLNKQYKTTDEMIHFIRNKLYSLSPATDLNRL